MPSLEETGSAVPAHYDTAPPASEQGASDGVAPLCCPAFGGDAPLDALGQLLLELEQQNQASLSVNIEAIATARERLEDLQRQLAEQLKKALEAAHRSHKKKGWFSRTFGSIVNSVAKIFAKHIEVMKDIVVFPADVAMSFGKALANREALMQSLRDDLAEFNKSSETERALEGFTSGTLKFMGDVVAFECVVVAALAEGAVRGDPLAHAVGEQARQLYGSLQTNILDNPDFWTVVGKVAEAAAVAGALASGGALGIAAAALIVALEADKRYGFIEDSCGKEAAPWVHLGLTVAAGVATAGAAGGSSETLRLIQLTAAALGGAGDIYVGIRTMQESRRQADEMYRQADMQETLNGIRENQRLIEALIDLYEEKNDNRTQTIESSVRLVETQANTERALVFQA